MNIERIRLSEMKVDSTYQRQVDDKRVKHISAKWDDNKAQLIHVSHRADGYYVMDGSHTRLAARKVGIEELPCRVYEGLTVEDEARFFSELNSSQKKPRFAEILKAKATAGMEPEKSYFQLFADADVPYSLCATKNNVNCHAALMQVYKKTDYTTMLRAMKTAKQAIDGREEFYHVGHFCGLCALVTSHPELNDDRLISVVRKVTSSKVREMADLYRRSEMGGGRTVTSEYVKAYIDIYNKGLRYDRIEK